MNAASLSTAALYAALAEPGVTLITPNRRLAAHHKRKFDAAQRAAGRRAWASADIVPLGAFVERSWRALTLAHPEENAFRLIEGAHAALLWEQIIRASPAADGLMNVALAARQAAAAWALAHAWQLWPAMQVVTLSGDAALFLDWSRRYRERCADRRLLDAATLPDALAREVAVDARELPAKILLAGFDIVTPQQHHLWRALGEAGVAVETVGAPDDREARTNVRRLEFADDRAEMRAAAAWARQNLAESPSRRIAIVMPDLQTKRAAIARELTDALSPGSRARDPAHAASRAALFNISLGEPLGNYALTRAALGMLAFSSARPLPFHEVSALLRSPYLASADVESTARALLDAALRERSGNELSLSTLQETLQRTSRLSRLAKDCPALIEALARVASLPPTGARRSPNEWSRHFSRVLAAWGFPGERSLDSDEHQVLAKFREAIAALGGAAAVQPKMRADEALAALRRAVADTMFQPESEAKGEAPIEVLGVLESAGQSFDALWVCGLSDEAWPLPARANPFVPVSLQRSAGVPEASASAALKLDQRITEGWLRAADTVVLSHACRDHGGDGEQVRSASPLIRELPPAALSEVLPDVAATDYAQALQAIGRRESIVESARAPLPAPTAIRGGAAALRDQAACPFRAFARHRLGAKTLESPQAGLDARARGNLLHRVLYLSWGEIGDHAKLMSLASEEVSGIVAKAVAAAIAEMRATGVAMLSGHYAEIEHRRLRRVTEEWFAYERTRTPFAVVEREAARRVELAGLGLQLRLDRLDRLADGTYALIDYKTGEATLRAWLGDRPDEPQLPLYCQTAEQAIVALAFARLKRGKHFGFEGLSAVEGLLPDVSPVETKPRLVKQGYPSWDVITATWESALNSLAGDFSRGRADVDPKRGGATCAQCDLQSLCRVGESDTSTLQVDEEGEDDE